MNFHSVVLKFEIQIFYFDFWKFNIVSFKSRIVVFYDFVWVAVEFICFLKIKLKIIFFSFCNNIYQQKLNNEKLNKNKTHVCPTKRRNTYQRNFNKTSYLPTTSSAKFNFFIYLQTTKDLKAIMSGYARLKLNLFLYMKHAYTHVKFTIKSLQQQKKSILLLCYRFS